MTGKEKSQGADFSFTNIAWWNLNGETVKDSCKGQCIDATCQKRVGQQFLHNNEYDWYNHAENGSVSFLLLNMVLKLAESWVVRF